MATSMSGIGLLPDVPVAADHELGEHEKNIVLGTTPQGNRRRQLLRFAAILLAGILIGVATSAFFNATPLSFEETFQKFRTQDVTVASQSTAGKGSVDEQYSSILSLSDGDIKLLFARLVKDDRTTSLLREAFTQTFAETAKPSGEGSPKIRATQEAQFTGRSNTEIFDQGTSPQPSQGLTNIIFMADIGHAREHQSTLTWPPPMEKSAVEGSFALYDALYDYTTLKHNVPDAIFILGDVSYVGGDPSGNLESKHAFQKYTNGTVSADRVFPVIGNHDISYYGCDVPPKCYYGTGLLGVISTWQMEFDDWRQSWLDAFSGLQSVISPPRSSNVDIHVSMWQPPTRFNVNLNPKSCVYFIVGLLTGSDIYNWQDDTPKGSQDGVANPDIECAFLADSLAHGKSLGKTIFIYMTHNFHLACTDWSLIQQIDIWIYGHLHNYWQSPEPGGAVLEETRYYPVRLLIGNGGFDEGDIDVVNFGHLYEEVSLDGTRVKLHFDILDACVSAQQECPEGWSFSPHCWWKCKSFEDGFNDHAATPSSHGFGFTFEAPLLGRARRSDLPFWAQGTWKLNLGAGSNKAWLKLGDCGSAICAKDTGGSCHWFSCDPRRKALPCTDDGRCLCDTEHCAVNGICVKPDACIKDTGGTCTLFSCDSSRNATCENKVCVCGEGMCVLNGQCVPHSMPETSVNTAQDQLACLVATAQKSDASTFAIYDINPGPEGVVLARMAIVDEKHASVVLDVDKAVFVQGPGFYDVGTKGVGWRPTDGHQFALLRQDDAWTIQSVTWLSIISSASSFKLAPSLDHEVNVVFDPQ